MVAQGDDAGPCGEDASGHGGEDTVALGGVFAVDHGEVGVQLPPEGGELLLQKAGAIAAGHIADE